MIQNSQQRSPGAEPQAVNLPQVAPSIPQLRHDMIGLGPDGMTTIINTPPSSAGSVHRKPPRGLSNGKPRNKAGNKVATHTRSHFLETSQICNHGNMLKCKIFI